MDDLVKRLRDWETIYPSDYDKPDGSLYLEAADRIEADAERINILEMREVSRNAERLSALNNNAAQAQMIAKRDARIAELEAAIATQAWADARAKNAAEARVQVLEDALRELDKAASEVARHGAQTGPQWSKLTIASLKARAALEGEK